MKGSLFLCILFNSTIALCQSAEVQFIPLDSIDFLKKDEQVKIDFKGKDHPFSLVETKYKSLKGAKFNSKYMLFIGDTVRVTLDGRQVEFIEIKGKTTDYYVSS